MRLADLVIVLPGIYVVLALRGVLPLVLTRREVFVALVAVLSLVGWPPWHAAYAEFVVVERQGGVRRSCARARRGILAR